MHVTNITLSKQYKIGLPQFSNITVGTSVTWELKEGDVFDYTKSWDLINQQLDIQASNGTDPSWLQKDEFNKHYSTTIKTPKKTDYGV